MKKSTITKEQLLENGWEETGDDVVPIHKIIGTAMGDEDHPDKLSLVLHRYNNVNMFAVSMPDGALLNFNPASIKQLNAFEKLILSYEPAY